MHENNTENKKRKFESDRYKSVLVTGASRGIGFELVKQFLETQNVEKIFAAARSKSANLEKLKEKYPKR